LTVRYLDDREVAFRAAVNLAIESVQAGNWEDAAEANRQAIALAPEDVTSHNRLGKALSELGRIAEALEVYSVTAQLDPHNAIARRNLDRLGHIAASTSKRRRPGAVKAGSRGEKAMHRGGNGAAGKTGTHGRVRSGAFLADHGKSTVTQLRNLAPAFVLATVAPGDLVALEPEEGAVGIATPNGEYLGSLDSRLGTRLARLMAGGNRYEAAVASAVEGNVSLLIREVYRAPALARQVSFPRSPPKNGAPDQDAPDTDDLLLDDLDGRYLDDDDEEEPLSEATRVEKLNALRRHPIAAREKDSLAV